MPENEVVIKQHMVWRRYLKEWTDDLNSTNGHLYCLFKDKGIITPQRLMSIAYENYAYDVSMMNENDIRVFFLMLKNALNNLNIYVNFTNNFSYIDKDFLEKELFCKVENEGAEFLDKLLQKKMPFDDDSLSYNDLLLYYTYESLKDGSIITKESFNKVIATLKIDEKIKYKDKKFSFFEFVVIQWLRTQNSKKLINKITEECKNEFPEGTFKGTSEALYPLILLVQSFAIPYNLFKKNYFIELIDNQTDVNFITGDNPVVSCGNEEELKFYYPISPKIAILIKNSISANKITTISEDENFIYELNDLIYENSLRQVYAKDKTDLNKYLLNKN